MLQILDLDITMSYANFKQNLDSFLGSFGNQNTKNEIKEIATRQGKTVYKVELTNTDENNQFSIIFEKNGSNGDVIMKPLAFTNMRSGYYETTNMDPDDEGTVNDASLAFSGFMSHISSLPGVNGTFACIDPNSSLVIVKNGSKKSGKLAAVDGDGNLYGATDAKKMSMSSDGGFSVNRPLNEWLADPDQLPLQTKLQTVATPQEKADLIGKYLIYKKIRSEIDFDEFYDIFRQPGMLIGYTDKELTTIYQLIM